MVRAGAFIAMAGALVLSACATVSVIPGSGPVQQTVSLEQSAIRSAATAFTKNATDRRWIADDGGFMQFARVLAHGRTEGAETGSQAETYLAQLSEVDSRSHLNADIERATRLLKEMSDKAANFLAIDRADRAVTSRGDLVSFERALVRAGKSRETLRDASAMLDAKTSADPEASLALLAFDDALDRAGKMADRMAREYTTRSVGAVS